MRIDDGDGSPKTELSADFRQLCRGGNLASSPCRWRSLCCGKGGARTRTRTTTTAGRKRPRSDEGGPTRDEDYENNESDGGGESSPSSCPEGENWLCLECGAVLCSRYGNGHAKLHQEGAGGGTAAGHCHGVRFEGVTNATISHQRSELREGLRWRRQKRGQEEQNHHLRGDEQVTLPVDVTDL